MRRLARMIAACLIVTILGCVPTLYPVYGPQDVVFDPALLGTWVPGDESCESWTFERAAGAEGAEATGAGDAYWLTHVDGDGRHGRFLARLVRLGDGGPLLLDLYAGELPGDVNDLYKLHFVPAHTFLHVEQVGPTLRMRAMNPNWLTDLLTENPDAVRHEQLDPGPTVLSASTEELQAFIREHIDTPKAWGDAMELARPAPTTQPAP